ncbi:MAG: amidase [Acidobacteria bacterium]|nr:amidase [Acidobacteriota bacterium]
MPRDALVFSSLTELSRMIRSKRISPVELAQEHIARIKGLDAKLLSVITLTEELALEQARQAEKEISRSQYRGPLHGIPYGVKDLLDTKNIRTTWGLKHHGNRIPTEDATVVAKLGTAGGVLIAKLSMGELARGATWFGGTTRCPWDTTRSSGGSSAGPGAATAAGFVVFSIGSETMGSLLGPAAACGVTGLRPTYGRVSRAGAMALSWTIDKLGPMCRSVGDCAHVFDAIRGADPRDPSVVEVPHRWNPTLRLPKLRVGVVESEFDGVSDDRVKKVLMDAVAAIEKLGMTVKPIELPDYPYQAVFEMVRGAEAAVFFEELIQDGLDSLTDNAPRAWKNLLRVARFTPAVHYLKAQQVRTMMQTDVSRLMQEIDLWVAPAGGPATPIDRPAQEPRAAPRPAPQPRTLNLTNLTGQPALCLPAGFVDGLPIGTQLVGRSFDEQSLLALGHAYQQATGWHLRHPTLS